MPTIDSKQFVYIYFNNPLLALAINDDDLRLFINRGELRFETGYALSNSSEETRTIRFEHQGKFIEIKPGATGLPTVRDLDVLLYCSSWLSHESYLMKAKTGKVGNASNTVTIIPEDFYEFSKRGPSSKRQDGFIQALERFSSTVLSTNISTEGNQVTKASPFIESCELERINGILKKVHITFPVNMIMRIVAHTGVRIELHPDFFTMKPLQRVIYLLLKQNCGTEFSAVNWHQGYAVPVVIGIATGYLSHLAGDWLTNSGVPLLWPNKRRFVSPIKLCTGDRREYVLAIVLYGWSIMESVRILK